MENKFCFCDKGDDANSIMIQWFFCENWFHKEHLNIFGINLENVKEEDLPDLPLICKNCVIKLKDVLKGYDLKKIIYGLMPKIQTESSKLNEIIDNNKEKEPLSLLGKKRKPSNDLEEIKEDDGNPTLIQCFFCEDYFHEKHLNIFGIDLENVKEEDLPDIPLVCNNCVIKLKDILKGYDLKKIVYGSISKVQNETSKLPESNDNNKGDEPLSLLGKKGNLRKIWKK